MVSSRAILSVCILSILSIQGHRSQEIGPVPGGYEELPGSEIVPGEYEGLPGGDVLCSFDNQPMPEIVPGEYEGLPGSEIVPGEYERLPGSEIVPGEYERLPGSEIVPGEYEGLPGGEIKPYYEERELHQTPQQYANRLVYHVKAPGPNGQHSYYRVHEYQDRDGLRTLKFKPVEEHVALANAQGTTQTRTVGTLYKPVIGEQGPINSGPYESVGGPGIQRKTFISEGPVVRKETVITNDAQAIAGGETVVVSKGPTTTTYTTNNAGATAGQGTVVEREIGPVYGEQGSTYLDPYVSVGTTDAANSGSKVVTEKTTRNGQTTITTTKSNANAGTLTETKETRDIYSVPVGTTNAANSGTEVVSERTTRNGQITVTTAKSNANAGTITETRETRDIYPVRKETIFTNNAEAKAGGETVVVNKGPTTTIYTNNNAGATAGQGTVVEREIGPVYGEQGSTYLDPYVPVGTIDAANSGSKVVTEKTTRNGQTTITTTKSNANAGTLTETRETRDIYSVPVGTTNAANSGSKVVTEKTTRNGQTTITTTKSNANAGTLTETRETRDIYSVPVGTTNAANSGTEVVSERTTRNGQITVTTAKSNANAGTITETRETRDIYPGPGSVINAATAVGSGRATTTTGSTGTTTISSNSEAQAQIEYDDPVNEDYSLLGGPTGPGSVINAATAAGSGSATTTTGSTGTTSISSNSEAQAQIEYDSLLQESPGYSTPVIRDIDYPVNEDYSLLGGPTGPGSVINAATAAGSGSATTTTGSTGTTSISSNSEAQAQIEYDSLLQENPGYSTPVIRDRDYSVNEDYSLLGGPTDEDYLGGEGNPVYGDYLVGGDNPIDGGYRDYLGGGGYTPDEDYLGGEGNPVYGDYLVGGDNPIDGGYRDYLGGGGYTPGPGSVPVVPGSLTATSTNSHAQADVSSNVQEQLVNTSPVDGGYYLGGGNPTGPGSVPVVPGSVTATSTNILAQAKASSDVQEQLVNTRPDITDGVYQVDEIDGGSPVNGIYGDYSVGGINRGSPVDGIYGDYSVDGINRGGPVDGIGGQYPVYGRDRGYLVGGTYRRYPVDGGYYLGGGNPTDYITTWNTANSKAEGKVITSGETTLVNSKAKADVSKTKRVQRVPSWYDGPDYYRRGYYRRGYYGGPGEYQPDYYGPGYLGPDYDVITANAKSSSEAINSKVNGPAGTVEGPAELPVPYGRPIYPGYSGFPDYDYLSKENLGSKETIIADGVNNEQTIQEPIYRGPWGPSRWGGWGYGSWGPGRYGRGWRRRRYPGGRRYLGGQQEISNSGLEGPEFLPKRRVPPSVRTAGIDGLNYDYYRQPENWKNTDGQIRSGANAKGKVVTTVETIQIPPHETITKTTTIASANTDAVTENVGQVPEYPGGVLESLCPGEVARSEYPAVLQDGSVDGTVYDGGLNDGSTGTVTEITTVAGANVNAGETVVQGTDCPGDVLEPGYPKYPKTITDTEPAIDDLCDTPGTQTTTVIGANKNVESQTILENAAANASVGSQAIVVDNHDGVDNSQVTTTNTNVVVSVITSTTDGTQPNIYSDGDCTQTTTATEYPGGVLAPDFPGEVVRSKYPAVLQDGFINNAAGDSSVDSLQTVYDGGLSLNPETITDTEPAIDDLCDTPDTQTTTNTNAKSQIILENAATNASAGADSTMITTNTKPDCVDDSYDGSTRNDVIETVVQGSDSPGGVLEPGFTETIPANDDFYNPRTTAVTGASASVQSQVIVDNQSVHDGVGNSQVTTANASAAAGSVTTSTTDGTQPNTNAKSQIILENAATNASAGVDSTIITTNTKPDCVDDSYDGSTRNDVIETVVQGSDSPGGVLEPGFTETIPANDDFYNPRTTAVTGASASVQSQVIVDNQSVHDGVGNSQVTTANASAAAGSVTTSTTDGTQPNIYRVGDGTQTTTASEAEAIAGTSVTDIGQPIVPIPCGNNGGKPVPNICFCFRSWDKVPYYIKQQLGVPF